MAMFCFHQHSSHLLLVIRYSLGTCSFSAELTIYDSVAILDTSMASSIGISVNMTLESRPCVYAALLLLEPLASSTVVISYCAL